MIAPRPSPASAETTCRLAVIVSLLNELVVLLVGSTPFDEMRAERDVCWMRPLVTCGMDLERAILAESDAAIAEALAVLGALLERGDHPAFSKRYVRLREERAPISTIHIRLFSSLVRTLRLLAGAPIRVRLQEAHAPVSGPRPIAPIAIPRFDTSAYEVFDPELATLSRA